jgi:hypothetical protein
MKALDLFAFAARTARETWPIDRLTQPVTSPPITAKDGPRECCAQFAAPDEIVNGSTIYRCGVCGRLFAVPH